MHKFLQLLVAATPGDRSKKKFVRYTRYNDEIVSERSFYTQDPIYESYGYYKNGVTIVRLADNKGFTITTKTIENNRHVLNFRCNLDHTGKLTEPGVINYFSLGMGVLDDQEYVDEYLDEIYNKFGEDPATFWDKVSVQK